MVVSARLWGLVIEYLKNQGVSLVFTMVQSKLSIVKSNSRKVEITFTSLLTSADHLQYS